MEKDICTERCKGNVEEKSKILQKTSGVDGFNGALKTEQGLNVDRKAGLSDTICNVNIEPRQGVVHFHYVSKHDK